MIRSTSKAMIASRNEPNFTGIVLELYRGQSEWATTMFMKMHERSREKRHNMQKPMCIREVNINER